MTLRKAICAAILVLGALASATADARHVRFGFHFGFPVFPPYWHYPPPVYYYPPPVATIPAPPPVYVERSDAASASPPAESYWYYCPDSKAYYPYVRECGSEWQRVSPRPPQ